MCPNDSVEPVKRTRARRPGANARREHIVQLIRASIAERGYAVSATELARETNVSVRQIVNDLEVLKADGRVDWERGKTRTLRLIE